MKLYATTTSERASKGQGGNHLNISITDENKKVLMSIEAKMIDNKPIIEVIDYTKYKLCNCGMNPGFHIKQSSCKIPKGNKQKGECKTHVMFTNNICDTCGKHK